MAATPEINGRKKVDPWVIGGFDALDAWDGVKDQFLLFAIVVGNKSIKGEFAQVHDGAVLRPLYSDVVDCVSFVRKLHMEVEGNGAMCDALRELINEEVWGLRFDGSFIKILNASVSHDTVAPETNSSLTTDELHCFGVEVALTSEAGRWRF